MKTKEEIIKELLKSIENIDISNDPRDKERFLECGEYREVTHTDTGGEDIIVAYKEEALQYIETALNTVFDFNSKNNFCDLVSEEFVRKELEEIIKKALLDKDPNKNNIIISEVGRFLKSVRKEDSVFFTHVINLKSSKTYDFGNVKIYPNESISKNCFLTDHEKHSISEGFKKFEVGARVSRRYSIAEVHISATEKNKADEKAFHNLDQFLNILRVFCAAQIWIEGDTIPERRSYFSYNKSTRTFTETHQHLDAELRIRSFDLDELYELNPKLMNKIENILKKGNRNQLENKIVNSLIWLGESVKEIDDTHKLLKMVISLEVLLLEKEAKKRSLLAERSVFLLGGKNFDDGIKIKKSIDEVYKVRSEIVHEGTRPNIRKGVLDNLFAIISDLNIKILMTDEFESMEDIGKFVERCKYGSEIETIKNHEWVKIIEGKKDV